MRVVVKFLCITASALAIVACGGGGGGGSSAAPNAGPPAPITVNNGGVTAAVGTDAALGSGALAGLGDTGVLLPVRAGGPGSDRGGISGAVMKAIHQQADSGTALQPQVIVTLPPEDCLVDGTITVTADLQDPSTLSQGDRLSADFMNCDDGDGTVIDGAFNFTFVSFSQSIVDCLVSGICTDQDRLTVQLDLQNFSVTDMAEIVSVDGDMRMTLDTRNPPVEMVTISGDFLSVSANGVSSSLYDYSTTSTNNVTTGAYSVDALGQAESSVLNGSIAYETTVPFQGTEPADPDVGTLVITGADGATVVVMALGDAFTVRVVVDLEDDGTPEDTMDYTYSELENLL